jgi:hypothetical protein
MTCPVKGSGAVSRGTPRRVRTREIVRAGTPSSTQVLTHLRETPIAAAMWA